MEGNDESFSKVGTFFPFAIGNSSKMGKASVLENGKRFEIILKYRLKLLQIIDFQFFRSVC